MVEGFPSRTKRITGSTRGGVVLWYGMFAPCGRLLGITIAGRQGLCPWGSIRNLRMGGGTSGGLRIFKLSEEGVFLWQPAQNVVRRMRRGVSFV